jgi:4-amino-4-deoxychorismate lyase
MTLLALAVGGRGVVDPDEPVLHADDEALLRGRAAFETLRVYAGRPFKLDEHVARILTSGERIGLPPVEPGQLEALAHAALAAAGVKDAVLRLYWTAGREKQGRPTTLALVSRIPDHIEPTRERGIALASLQLGFDPEVRARAPWLLGGVKSTSYAVNMAADQEAKRRGADDALFLANGDIVLEGPVTNIWWRLGRTLYTPALELGILAGVTRGALLEAAPGLGYEIEECAFPLAELAGAEEAFTSSSVREIMPVVRLDGAAVGPGKPAEAARAVQAALRDAALPP